ncbi:MAG: MAPEG family protein [Sphingomonas bacterium]|nr:MAPEG family protein [Sphingomonas bacterium]
MTYSPLLGPIVALVAWTLVMLTWMAATRMLAMKKAGIDITKRVGGRGQSLEGVLPDEVNWKSHNYTHLMEQPTLFYAITIVLVLIEQNSPINVWLAWGYVAFRIVHSIVQSTINQVKYRFPLFAVSTLCLVGLTVHAGAALLHR